MKEMTLPAAKESIPRMTAFIDGQLEAAACPVKAQLQIDLVLDEVLSNIAAYAYGAGPGEVTVRFDLEDASRTASITFLDSGCPFDPLARPDPDVTASAEERDAGGLGIYLVKKTMDDVQYRYEKGRNVLTVRKRLDQSGMRK